MKNVLAFSGGKDSTAMAIRLAELGEDFELFFTPAGNEPPELFAHIDAISKMLNRPVVVPDNKPLDFWIEFFNALPNWRQRWCTRLIKIKPCIAYLEAHPGSTLMVGLRADEEEREGLYGSYAKYRYPLREFGWGIKEVWAYLDEKKIVVPKRTDCMLCFGQRIGEWYDLWRKRPEEFAKGEVMEMKTGFTFRSPARDTWPAPLKELRLEFERGRKPRGMKLEVIDEEEQKHEACRVCRC